MNLDLNSGRRYLDEVIDNEKLQEEEQRAQLREKSDVDKFEPVWQKDE